MPSFEEGLLRAIKFRNLRPGEPRFWAAKGSAASLFNYDSIAYKSGTIFIVKGEIPTMLMHQLGFLACTITGGEGVSGEQWYPQLSFAERRIVVGDNDRDPETREKMQAAASRRASALKAELFYPPIAFKDIDEWILKDPSAVDVIRNW